MQDKQHTLMAACQVAGIGLAGLILPSALIDLAFDTDFLGILAQATLTAFACALMVALAIDPPQQLATSTKSFTLQFF